MNTQSSDPKWVASGLKTWLAMVPLTAEQLRQRRLTRKLVKFNVDMFLHWTALLCHDKLEVSPHV